MPEFTASEKLRAVRRELGLRLSAYPRRVERRTMTQRNADFEIGVFRAIEADYARLAATEELPL